MGIVEVVVVVGAGVALASVLCWLIYSVATREVDRASDRYGCTVGYWVTAIGGLDSGEPGQARHGCWRLGVDR